MNKNQLGRTISALCKLASALDEKEEDIIECLSGVVITEQEAGEIREAMKEDVDEDR